MPPTRIKAALHAVPANFEQVFAKAAGGDTILLGAGNYGSFAAGVKPSAVTIRPEPRASARMALAFSAAANVRLQGLTIDGADIGGSTHDVTIAGSTFTRQVVIHAEHMSGARIVLRGNRLPRIDVCAECYEGRVHVVGESGRPSGIVIASNVLGPGGNSDGIQISANGVRILDNTFVGIQGTGGRHIDALQLYGESNTVIRGNYFRDVVSSDHVARRRRSRAHRGQRLRYRRLSLRDHARGRRRVRDPPQHDARPRRLRVWPAVRHAAHRRRAHGHRPGKGTVVEDNMLGALSVAGSSTLAPEAQQPRGGGGRGRGRPHRLAHVRRRLAPDVAPGLPAGQGLAGARGRIGRRRRRDSRVASHKNSASPGVAFRHATR